MAMEIPAQTEAAMDAQVRRSDVRDPWHERPSRAHQEAGA
jgi:hypothetical protein